MLRSRDIYIFVFLWNPQISKSVMSSQVLLRNRSYTLCLFLLNPKYHENEIWSTTGVLYDKQF